MREWMLPVAHILRASMASKLYSLSAARKQKLLDSNLPPTIQICPLNSTVLPACSPQAIPTDGSSPRPRLPARRRAPPSAGTDPPSAPISPLGRSTPITSFGTTSVAPPRTCLPVEQSVCVLNRRHPPSLGRGRRPRRCDDGRSEAPAP